MKYSSESHFNKYVLCSILFQVESRQEKGPDRKKIDSKLLKHADAVEKMHQDLVSRIAARHSEL